AFSMLTTATSTSYCLRSLGRSVTRARRPGSPNTSPTQRTVTGRVMPACPGASLRHLDRARLTDDHDLDVAGVLHLGLDALADVLGELVRVEVGDLLGLGHDAQLAAGLDRVAHLHDLV